MIKLKLFLWNINLIIVCLWKGTGSTDTTSVTLHWIYCVQASLFHEETLPTTLMMSKSTLTSVHRVHMLHPQESTGLSPWYNWTPINYDQKDDPEENGERNVKHGTNGEWMWKEQAVEGGLLGWHVLGAQRLAATQEHICVLFARHPREETTDSKQKPDGAHKGVTRWENNPSSQKVQNGHPEPAQTWSPH